MQAGTWFALHRGNHLTFKRAKQLVLNCIEDDAYKACGKPELEKALLDAWQSFDEHRRFATTAPVCVHGYRYRITRDTTIEEY